MIIHEGGGGGGSKCDVIKRGGGEDYCDGSVTEGGEGVQNSLNLCDVIYERPPGTGLEGCDSRELGV